MKAGKGSVVAPESDDVVAAMPLTSVGQPDMKAVRAATDRWVN